MVTNRNVYKGENLLKIMELDTRINSWDELGEPGLLVHSTPWNNLRSILEEGLNPTGFGDDNDVKVWFTPTTEKYGFLPSSKNRAVYGGRKQVSLVTKRPKILWPKLLMSFSSDHYRDSEVIFGELTGLIEPDNWTDCYPIVEEARELPLPDDSFLPDFPREVIEDDGNWAREGGLYPDYKNFQDCKSKEDGHKKLQGYIKQLFLPGAIVLDDNLNHNPFGLNGMLSIDKLLEKTIKAQDSVLDRKDHIPCFSVNGELLYK